MLDYHIHTTLCGHASGSMEEYIEFALTQPLREIGFSDHLPMIKWAHPEYAMPFEKLLEYVQRVLALRQTYPQLPIKLGIEADYYSPAEEAATRSLLAQHPFDYVYGSVHFVEDWAIDDPHNLDQWERVGVDTVYELYFAQLQKAARSGLFDIVTHTDLPKKFGHRPTKDFSALIETTIRSYKDAGMVVEINTSGLRKPVKEMYPAIEILKLLKKYEIPLVFGSDAHAPDQVGRDFAQARQMAQACGFTEIAVFEQRKIVDTYPL
ncbi:histidinol phosphate phosphatase HisJ family [Candidatus Moduliflexus flocculans]|uniref:Histidinol-phosphatase n=1 Tax=Candidatus Moduliflexus flocculans TaxID=1499966 RepID=A0A0S6VS54_9BACT|nr:histidinol phosphate phosphatase HisJ family [Candidatus Moduliflexus flocculans]